MGQYLMGIIGAAAVIGIMEAIVPQSGKNKGYMRLVTGLCLLCLVVKPLSAVAETLPEFFSDRMGELAQGGEEVKGRYEEILEGEILETVREQLCAAVKEELEKEFGVERCEVGISLVREEGELGVERIVVTLMGKDVFKNPYAMEEYLVGVFGGECLVVVG